MPGMYLMVLQVARAAPRIAYMSVSLISSSVAPACCRRAHPFWVLGPEDQDRSLRVC
jgi:hypothetical protein